MKEERKFVLTAFHCSGGHGDTFSILGVFNDLCLVMKKIRDLQLRQSKNDGFRMDSVDHGFFVHLIEPNQLYSSSERAPVICAVRFQIAAGKYWEWKEEWFSRPYYEFMKKAGYTTDSLFIV